MIGYRGITKDDGKQNCDARESEWAEAHLYETQENLVNRLEIHCVFEVSQ